MHYLHTTISMGDSITFKKLKIQFTWKKRLDVLHAKAQTYGSNPVTFSSIRG